MDECRAAKTPLIELLRSVPKHAVEVYEHNPTHHQNIPYGRLCHEAADALEAWNRRAEAQWQPIETAPKELGKRILGLKDCGEGTLTSISIMFWLNDGEWHLNDCATRTAEGFGYRVTHWMPLPAEPEVKQ